MGTHICIYTVITENNLKIAILINVYTHKKKARIIFVVAYRIQTYIFQSSNHCQRCRGQQQKHPGGRGRAGKRRRLLRDSFSLHLNDSMTIEKKKKSFKPFSSTFVTLGLRPSQRSDKI